MITRDMPVTVWTVVSVSARPGARPTSWRPAPAQTGGHVGRALDGVYGSAHIRAVASSGAATPWG